MSKNKFNFITEVLLVFALSVIFTMPYWLVAWLNTGYV